MSDGDAGYSVRVLELFDASDNRVVAVEVTLRARGVETEVLISPREAREMAAQLARLADVAERAEMN